MLGFGNGDRLVHASNLASERGRGRGCVARRRPGEREREREGERERKAEESSAVVREEIDASGMNSVRLTRRFWRPALACPTSRACPMTLKGGHAKQVVVVVRLPPNVMRCMFG